PEDIEWKPFKMKNPNALGQRAMAVTTAGKNRIMIYGPKPDGTYVVEQATVLEACGHDGGDPAFFVERGCSRTSCAWPSSNRGRRRHRGERRHAYGEVRD